MTRRILGVDVGLSGALALLDETGALLAVEDMPCLASGAKGRKAVNGPLLAGIIRRWAPDEAFVELVGPRPNEGAVQGFSFGRSRGVCEGVLAAAGVPVEMIAPRVWKRAANIAPGRENKDSARSVAIARWPTQAELFARKMDCDRAEAALIGLAGLKRNMTP